jgi:lipopolysaccharide heptosyltransferase I
LSASRHPRILISRLSAIGDTVLTLPVLNALREHIPDGMLAWVTQRASAQLLRGHEALDELIVLPRNWMTSPREMLRLRRRLRGLRIDTAIDVQGLTKSALPTWLSGARRRIGYARGEFMAREISNWFYTEAVRPIREHVVERNLELLRPLGIDHPRVRFRVPEHEQDARRVEQFLSAQGDLRRFAVMQPGAGWPSKLWPPGRFAAVARQLDQQYGVRCIVVWAGPEELGWARQIAAESAGRAIVAPATSLTELASLERRAALFVGPDTGPLHLAAAVGTPCVGLYGPMDATRCGPYGGRAVSVQSAHLTGGSRRRRKAGNETMRAISVEQVCEACDQILGYRGRLRTANEAA